MSPIIGICEDDAALRSVLVRGLEGEGFEVLAVGTGREAIERFANATNPPDAIVLDVGLPDADGRDVCQALRASGVTTPVLFLTARDAVVDRVAGFRSGGDDYLAKPFVLVELIVRLEALLRRAAPAVEPAPAAASGLVLDPAAHTVSAGDESVLLTPTEFRLLGALAREAGSVVRRRALVQAGWPDGATVHDNTLDSYLARLRRKLRSLGSDETIVTVRGVGYSLR